MPPPHLVNSGFDTEPLSTKGLIDNGIYLPSGGGDTCLQLSIRQSLPLTDDPFPFHGSNHSILGLYAINTPWNAQPQDWA